jgi:hypothetical protein
MEALLERGQDVENWNDDRLDELSRRMDAGFEEMRKGFARVDAKFDRIDERFDKLFFVIITVGGGFAATTIASLLGALLI